MHIEHAERGSSFHFMIVEIDWITRISIFSVNKNNSSF